MKKYTTIICLSVLIAIFVFMFIFTVCLSRTTESDYDANLSTWPEFTWDSFLSGEYLSDILYYFTDTIHSRDRFKDIETKIDDLYGFPEKQEVYNIYDEPQLDNEPVEDMNDDNNFDSNSSNTSDISNSIDTSSNVNDVTNDSSTSTESNTSNNNDPSSDTSIEDTSDVIDVTSPESSEDASLPNNNSEQSISKEPVEQVIPEIANKILIIGNRAIEVYGGNTNRAQEFANVLNEFADKIDSSVNIYSMVIPKASAYYIEQAKGYDDYVYRNKNDIDTICNNTSDRIIDVNIYNTLGRHAGEEIYLRTDHHWSALGAYYASELFSEKAGVAFADISEFNEHRREGYIGTMYKYTNYSSTILNNPEDFLIYYPTSEYKATYYDQTTFDYIISDKNQNNGSIFWDIPDNKKSSWYSTFIRGDAYSVKIKSESCKNGRKLLIVKDSYGNALAPFMLDGFEEIYIIDARQYKDSLVQTVENFGITDVLFAECTFSAVGKDYINNLKELCE